ncbi:hypothetical protein E4665_07560 [Sporolactobacillus shoreae]|uniref:Tetratricopeptide repeat protein n=1 Tax=Sporolactobacillus shoreae TaxID=1465501 RepID=A0A4Z0GP31_9BACL|nr:hypothetical protein [Sporolactobacillus shoreae]TGA98705.1 hypothetical protein E4665_07560 [Sporolactobacillus shoreae]
MKKIIAALAVLVLVLGACGNQSDQAFEKDMKQGRAAIQSENYDAAVKYFNEALSIKKGDRTAEALLAQVSHVRDAASSLKNGNPDAAVKAANAVLLQKGGSGVLIKRARELKAFAEGAKQMQTASGQNSASAGENSTASSSDTQTGSSSAVSGASGTSDSSSDSSNGASSQPSSSGTSEPAAQQQAEAAVAKAAGYTLNQVYVDTTDKGTYYSIELRENHSSDSAADPDTAPSIGFFRYYKDSGRITKLDIISNQYQDVKN